MGPSPPLPSIPLGKVHFQQRKGPGSPRWGLSVDPSPWSPQQLRRQLPPLALRVLGIQGGEKQLDMSSVTGAPLTHCQQNLLLLLVPCAGAAGKGGSGAAPCPTDFILGERENLLHLQNIYGCAEHKTTGRRSEIRILLTNRRPGPKENRTKFGRNNCRGCRSAGAPSRVGRPSLVLPQQQW